MAVNVVLDSLQIRDGEREEHIPSQQGDAERHGLVLLPNAFWETQFLFPLEFCFDLDWVTNPFSRITAGFRAAGWSLRKSLWPENGPVLSWGSCLQQSVSLIAQYGSKLYEIYQHVQVPFHAMSTGAGGLVCSKKDSTGGLTFFKKIKIWSSITSMESNMQQIVISTWMFPYIFVWEELVKTKHFNWTPSVLWIPWVFCSSLIQSNQ